MADLSLPPLTLVPLAEEPSVASVRRTASADRAVEPFAWPTPPLAAYPLPRCQIEPEPCDMESRVGAVTGGYMTAFEPSDKLLRFQAPPDRTILPIRFSELRQVTLKKPLTPLSAAAMPDADASARVLAHHPSQPYTVFLVGGEELSGQTIGHVETEAGLFLFPPADERGGVLRSFVPRSAYQRFQLGERIGAMLVEQHAASRAAVDDAIKAQSELRSKKIGEILVANRVVSQEQLLSALDKQARMPMVRLGEALVALGHVSEGQLQDALRKQHDDRTLPLGEMLVQRALVTRTQLQEALARKMGYPLVDLSSFPVDEEALSMVPPATALRLRVLPLMRRGGRLVVAMSDATRRDIVEELQRASQCLIAPALASDEQLLVATDEAYGHISAALAGGDAPADEGRGAGAMRPDGVPDAADDSAAGALDRITALLNQSADPGAATSAPVAAVDLIDAPLMPDLPVLSLSEAQGSPSPAPKASTTPAATRTSTSRASNNPAKPAKDKPARASGDNPLINAIVAMVQDARALGASDIHIETGLGDAPVLVRMRREGRMEKLKELPANFRNPLVGRLKTLAELDVAQTRRAQEGRLNFGKLVPDSPIEIGVSVLPTRQGLEDVVLRLPNTLQAMPLEELGLRSGDLERMHKVLERPSGLVLVVANGRSGRTTTLHAMLGAVQHPDRKVWTAEDRIDIELPYARQVEVQPRQGWGYADALRSFQAADPDIVLVGDVRDPAAAQLAVDAASSGQLVLAGLPGRGAADAITRLLDQDVPAYLLADCLSAVHAQRMVRRQCNHCRMSRPARASEVDEWLDAYLRHVAPDDQIGARDALMQDWVERFGRDGRLKRYHSPGCAKCNDTGHRGQVALHELLPIGRDLRQLIRAHAPVWHLQRQALRDGMHTMRQDAIEKMLGGIISVEEARMVAAH